MGVSIAYVIFGTLFLLVTGSTYAGVLVSIVCNRSLRDCSNFFIANLCISDFLLSLAVFVHSMFSGLDSADKVTEAQAVTTLSGLAIASYCLSSLIVAADRYFRVARPLCYARFMTNTRCAGIIAGSWAVLTGAVIIWKTVTFLARRELRIDQFGDERGNGSLPPSDDRHVVSTSYTIFINVVTIPCLLAAACFCIGLVGIARAQARRIHDEARFVGSVRSRLDRQVDSVQAPSSPCAPPARIPNRCRANTYLRVYLASFVLCWVPYIVMSDYFTFASDHSTDYILSQVFTWSISPITQVYFGTLFLTYTQAEHRRVLRANCRSILDRLPCRSGQ